MNMKITGLPSGLIALTVLAPVSWGSTYVTVTGLFPPDRPLFVAAVRVLPAGLVLLGAGALASPSRPRGTQWLRCVLLGLANFGIFFPLLAVAVYRLPGGVAAAAGGLQPLLVTGLSWLVAGRRPRPVETLVGCAAVVGVTLIVLRPAAGLDPVGVLAAAAANASFALGVVLSRRHPAPAGRWAWTGWQLTASAFVLVPLSLLIEGPPPAPDGKLWAGAGYLSLVCTAAAFMIWFHGIQKLPVVVPPLLGLAAPITGATLGWLLLGQNLSPVQLTGFAVTLGAVAYAAVLPPAADHATAPRTHEALRSRRPEADRLAATERCAVP